jgi:hypothetical protein
MLGGALMGLVLVLVPDVDMSTREWLFCTLENMGMGLEEESTLDEVCSHPHTAWL